MDEIKVIAEKMKCMDLAALCATAWIFLKQSAFDYDEMTLMARLATTLPGLRRGEKNND